jgi:hypothetical protein
LRAIWLSSLAWLIGGGPVVAFAIIWTMMADVTTESERYALFWVDGVNDRRNANKNNPVIEPRCSSNSELSQWEQISFPRLLVHGSWR